MTPFPADLRTAPRLPVTTGALRCRLPRRSPDALVLALLLTGAGARLAVMATVASSERLPEVLGAGLAAVALTLAAATLALGDRLPRWTLAAGVAATLVLDSVIVAASRSGVDALGHSTAYAWLMVYVALFFPAAAGWFAVLVGAACGLGLLASGFPGLLGGWLMVTVSTAVVGQVLCRLSRAVRGHLSTDFLTGALNRGGLAAAAARAAGRTRQHTEAMSVAVLDLDAFKAVNEREGHAGGDRLLVEATTAWREAMRGDDVLARTGGDEFVLVMPRTSPEQAELVLDRLRRAHPVQWSAGVARWQPGEPLDRCLVRADARLYAAKGALGGRSLKAVP
jgi:diguanylate cyclase (GGDEF)-like protein